MTPAGFDKLQGELKKILEIDRPANVSAIETALGHGDLRENAEYHAAKEEQARIAARLEYLQDRVARAQVINPTEVATEKIAFGATVRLRDLESETEVVYTFVGEDESDATRGRISITAPLARALIGKEEGDEVTVRLPKGERDYEVLSVEYKAID
jgi:transcription elongation factor GreA